MRLLCIVIQTALKSFGLSFRHCPGQQAFQEITPESLLGLAHCLSFGHFQGTGGRPVFNCQAVQQIELACRADNGQIPPRAIARNNRTQQASESRFGIVQWQ